MVMLFLSYDKYVKNFNIIMLLKDTFLIKLLLVKGQFIIIIEGQEKEILEHLSIFIN